MQNAKILQFQAFKLFKYGTWDQIISFEAAGSVVANMTGELAQQMSGPSFFPIESEVNTIQAECTINFGEVGSAVHEATMGASTSTYTISSTAGVIADEESIKGALVATGGDAITDLALSATTSDIKSGLYKLQLTNTTTMTADVIALSSPDLKYSDYSDFDKSIVKTVTLADGDTLDLGIGVNATCAATVNLANETTESAYLFRVFAPGAAADKSTVGQRELVIPKVKIMTLSRTMSDGRWLELFGHNCIFPGMSYNFSGEFSATEVAGQMLFDARRNEVAEIVRYYKAA